jgi:hypothetical protein
MDEKTKTKRKEERDRPPTPLQKASSKSPKQQVSVVSLLRAVVKPKKEWIAQILGLDGQIPREEQ